MQSSIETLSIHLKALRTASCLLIVAKACAGMGGGPGRGRPGLGMHGGGRPERPGEDLPDNCKLYVAGLSETLDDSMLRSLFEPYGNVMHAAGVLFSSSCLVF